MLHSPHIKSNLPLELVVHVYNINHGHNPEILNRSENLNGYSLLMGKIKEYNETFSLEESVSIAVKYCIENDILKLFLRNYGSEVINMLTDDISIEEIVAIRCEEAAEEGLERGREQASIQIARNLLAEGSTYEFIQKITGLDPETIKKL